MKKYNFIKIIKLCLIQVILSSFLIGCTKAENDNFAGLVKSEVRSENNKIEYEYNQNNLFSSIDNYDPLGNSRIHFTYNNKQQLTKWSYSYQPYSTTRELYYTYDNENRLIKYDGNSSPYDGMLTFEYNDSIVTVHTYNSDMTPPTFQLVLNDNRLVSKIIYNNIEYTTFEYDSHNNISRVYHYKGPNTHAEFTFTYDSKVNPFYGQFESIYLERFIRSFMRYNIEDFSGYVGYRFPYLKNNVTSVKIDGYILEHYSYAYENNKPINNYVSFPYPYDIYSYDYDINYY